VTNNFLHKYDDNSPLFQRFVNYSDKLCSLLSENKIKCSIFILPIPFAKNDYYQLERINVKLKKMFSNKGFLIDDLVRVYQAYPQNKLTLGALDPHPNDFATSLLAQEILKLLVIKHNLQNIKYPRPFLDNSLSIN
jgi:hypothetical protein